VPPLATTAKAPVADSVCSPLWLDLLSRRRGSTKVLRCPHSKGLRCPVPDTARQNLSDSGAHHEGPPSESRALACAAPQRVFGIAYSSAPVIAPPPTFPETEIRLEIALRGPLFQGLKCWISGVGWGVRPLYGIQGPHPTQTQSRHFRAARIPLEPLPPPTMLRIAALVACVASATAFAPGAMTSRWSAVVGRSCCTRECALGAAVGATCSRFSQA
jgi:hypothetical protein